MEPQMVQRDRMTLVGMDYYGPLSGEGWSAENPIGQLWQRFNRFWDAKSELIADRVVDPKAAYEVAIWNEEEYQATKSFYVFVGVEVKGLDEVPLELVNKVLPASTYALFAPAGKEITTWENAVYNEWLPESGYENLPRFSPKARCAHAKRSRRFLPHIVRSNLYSYEHRKRQGQIHGRSGW